ncbi:MAG: alpha/beta fold hydrolase [Afipia sp.]|nr:alpha/beta fold hydrolase [Afipia sp.]
MTANKTAAIGDMQVCISGDGPPLICVHGFTTTSEFWREQIETFSTDHLLIRPNLPGHGISPHPHEREYTIEAFVSDLESLFQNLRIDKAVLVGLSMGGTIAQKFALKNPTLLRGLVLVGATPHGLGPDVNVENVLRSIADVGIATASQNVIEKSFGSSAPRALVEFAKNEVIKTPEFVARSAIKSLNESDLRPYLKSILIPTLVIVGDEDVITPPSESKLLAKGIQGARLEIIKQAGHFPMLEQPAMFNRILRDFLEKRCRG